MARLVNKQFNTPIGLYSEQNIRDVIHRESQMLGNGVVGVNFQNPAVGKPSNLQNSAVLRMLEEEESRQRGGQGARCVNGSAIDRPLREQIKWPPPEYEQQNRHRSSFKDVVIPGVKRVAWPPPSEEGQSEQTAVQAQGGPQYYSQSPNLQQQNNVPVQQQPSRRYPLKPLDISNGTSISSISPVANQSPVGFRPATPSKPWAPVHSPVTTPGQPQFTTPANQSYQPAFYQQSPQQYQPVLQQYGPPAQQQYQPVPQQYQQPQQQYQSPQQQYQPPHQQYQSSQQQYQPPQQQYQAPQQQYQPPQQQYQPSQQQYQAPQQQYQPPQQQYQPSQQQYQPPQQQYHPPQQQYQPPQQQYQPPQSQQQYQAPPQSQPSQQFTQAVAAPTQIAPKLGVKSVQPPPSTITLRQQAPVSQPPPPLVTSQPATATLKGGKNLRGDLKWPPEPTRKRMDEDNRLRIELAKGPACRPRLVKKDYGPFFAQHALNQSYPGYKVPPGTQFYEHGPVY